MGVGDMVLLGSGFSGNSGVMCMRDMGLHT